MGRKPLPRSEKSVTFGVPLRPAKKRRWAAAARAEGVALAEFIRRAGDERADRVLASPPRAG